MQAQTDHTRHARMLFLVTALFWCGQYAYTPFINSELGAMGMSNAFMGLVSGSYGLSQTFLRLPLGLYADRMGRQKPFVLAGCLLLALALLVLNLFFSPMGFLFGRLLLGAAAASWVSFTVLYSSYFPHEEGPRRITQLNLGNMGGRLAGYLLVMALVPVFLVRSAFVLSLVCGALALLFAFFLKEAPHKSLGIRLSDLKAVAQDRYLRACAILGILTQAVAFSTYYGFIVNAAKALGASQSDLSLMNIWMLVPTLLMNYLITSPGFQRFKASTLVCLGFLLSAVYCVLVPRATSIQQIFYLQVLAGCSSSLTFAVLLGQSVRDIKGEHRAMGMGFYQAIYGIGMTLGPILTGLIADRFTLSTGFYFIAALSLISMPLSIRLLSLPPKSRV